MNYLTVELGFWATTLYVTVVAFVVATCVGRMLFRCKKHVELRRYEDGLRERERQELLRYFVGIARDCSYRPLTERKA